MNNRGTKVRGCEGTRVRGYVGARVRGCEVRRCVGARVRGFLGSLMLAMAVLVLAACDVETSGNGDLDGMWRLETVDTLATGGHCELGDELRTWSVQHRLLELRDHTGTAGAFLLRFDHHDNLLRTYQPYVFNRTDGDYPLESAAYMAPFGINALDATFTVVGLSSSKMQLRDDQLQLSFRKLN